MSDGRSPYPAYRSLPEAILTNDPWTEVNTIASSSRIRLSRSYVWELAVAVCRNCLTEKGRARKGIRGYMAVAGNYPRKSQEGAADGVTQRCDAEAHNAPSLHSF